VDGGVIVKANALDDISIKAINPIKKWTWFCPIEGCPIHGFKPMRKTMARKNGRYHLEKKHGLFGIYPILMPVDKDWRGCRYYESNGTNKINEQKVESIGDEQAFIMVERKSDSSQ
jgi:hypothetical protein